jgi:hypothetical protein
MEHAPVIRTALPKRRYQLGNYLATVLAEVDSGDTRRFGYIMAFVPDGEDRPVLYVATEITREAPGWRLVVINSAMYEELDRAAEWRDLEYFVEGALQAGTQLLGLRQEQAYRLT